MKVLKKHINITKALAMINYPLATSSWDDQEIEAIQSVIESGMYSMGKNVQEFESMFSNYFGTEYSVMVNSGSSANLLAVAALFYKKDNPLKAGDEVIVPSVSWSTTYHPLQQYGLKVKFVDIDIETLNLSLDQVKAAITDKTRLILAVNLLGNPLDYVELNKVIKGKNILLLEDNCESMGASLNNKKTGTWGIMGTYSCFFSHHISTMEGGVITTDDKELYHILLSLRAHGWTRNLPKENMVTGEKDDDPFKESFKFVLPGYNVRPIEMSGAIGKVQLKKLDNFIKERRVNAEVFVNEMKDNRNFIIQKEVGESSWFGFSIILTPESKLKRKDVLNALISKGVDVRPIVAGDFTKNEVIKYYNYEVFGEMKNAQYIDKNGFFIGNHHIDLKDKLVEITKTLKAL